MPDELCLTPMLQQAHLDLRAAQLQHEAVLQSFPLDAEDKRVLSLLLSGAVTASEVAESYPDAYRVLIVFWETQQFERLRSHVNSFLERPFSAKYQNPGYIIQKVYYEKAREDTAPATQPTQRKPARRGTAGHRLLVFILICISILFAVRLSRKSAEIKDLQAQLKEQYHERYSEGFSDGFDSFLSAYYNELRFFRNIACIVTTEGQRYHHFGCYHIAGRVFWIYNTGLAERNGYSPCLDCWDDGLLPTD